MELKDYSLDDILKELKNRSYDFTKDLSEYDIEDIAKYYGFKILDKDEYDYWLEDYDYKEKYEKIIKVLEKIYGMSIDIYIKSDILKKFVEDELKWLV